MVKLWVEISDCDTGETTKVTLPDTDLKNKIDISHDIEIIDWEGFLMIGFPNNIVKLNEVLEEINANCPNLTLEMLEKISETADSWGLEDGDFVKKLCSNDFLFEKVECEDNWLISTDEEKCAYFLVTEMKIPFAKNITEDCLIELKEQFIGSVNWENIWEYYEIMGFKIININETIIIFHWGDAVEN